MKRTLLLILFLSAMQFTMATPAKQVWRSYKQSDGTTITVAMYGDEFFHFYITQDKIPLYLEDNGNFCYAKAIGFGIASTGVIAHEPAFRTSTEMSSISSISDLCAIRDNSPSPEINRMRKASKIQKSIYDGTEKKGLVIMVSFSDQDFTIKKSDVEDMLNKEGYNLYKANGSVHDYYKEQSSGNFNVKFNIAGPVKLPKSCHYYGHVANTLYDNVGEMVAEACKAIDDTTDYKQYDWDGDGNVDMVFLLYAGYAAYLDSTKNLIWPHEYWLSYFNAYPKGITLDNVVINQYACGDELNDNGYMEGLGTFCHEFSHCLGLPDFYTYTGIDLMGYWDTLAYGIFLGNGWCPPNFTAYEKAFCGWKEPIELTSPTTINNLASSTDGGNTYRITNNCDSAGIDEYYLLENRQKTGWDKYLPGHGLMISHIDYDKNVWAKNDVNNDINHPRMTIFTANNTTKNADFKNMLYPTDTNDSLTDFSVPADTVFNVNKNGTKFMGKPITAIKENSDGTISFKFCGGNTPDGINKVTADINTFIGKPAFIYDSTGKLLKKVNSFNTKELLPMGIYMIMNEKGKVAKISF